MSGLREQGGYSVVEMVTVLAILGTVMGSLTGLFVAGTRAEIDMSARVEAQQQMRLALTKMRRELHCASDAVLQGTPDGSGRYPQVKITLGDYCRTGTGEFTWCTVSVATSRYALYRKPGATCDAAGAKWADYLTQAGVFTFTAASADTLAKLGVDFPVDRDVRDDHAVYRLTDAIVLRNTTRQ